MYVVHFFNSYTYCFNVHILPIYTFIWIGVVKPIAQPLFVFQDFRSHTFFVYPVIQHFDMFVFISSVSAYVHIPYCTFSHVY